MYTKSKIGLLLNSSGQCFLEDVDKCDLLNSYFASSCTVDNQILPPFEIVGSFQSALDSVDFNVSSTYAHLTKLKKSLAAGPDLLPPIFFSRLSLCLANPVNTLNSLLFSTGELPSVWKTAFITPVYKKGKTNDVANYRPIALTCVLCKIFEQTLKEALSNHLLANNLLSSRHHGFLAGHSTCTNLLDALNNWTNNMKDCNLTRVVYVDFSKAFDSICHSKLLLKLESYGVSGRFLGIINHFLTGRSQVVKINNSVSEVCNISSGVPQGSVLGPILFIIYMNDLMSVLSPNVTITFFADDVKLFSVIKSSNDLILCSMTSGR